MGNITNSTLSRKIPLSRKKPWAKSKPPRARNDDFRKIAASSKPKGMRRISKKREKAMREDYFPANKAFLERPENRYCLICICRSINATWTEAKDIMRLPLARREHVLHESGAVLAQATEVHHQRGRIGRLLAFVPLFIPSCRGCREWPHVHRVRARELDLVASATDYDTFPR